MDVLLLGLVVIVLGFIVWAFNALTAQRNACLNARAGIDVNLQRRHQLIPNLVNVVRGYANHEQATLVEVAKTREAAIAALGRPASASAEAQLEYAVSTLAARVEQYPDLKSDQVYLQLMRNLTEAEEQISASRRAFNAQVMRMNNVVQQFPTLLVARPFGFVALKSYSANTAVEQAPKVDLHSGGIPGNG